MTATQAPTPGPLSGEQISALVQEQMHDCWYEICADTGCHPLDIVQLGRKRLEYKPGHWTRFVGDAVAARLAPLAQIGDTPCLNSSCSSLSSSDGAGKSGTGSSPTAPVEASGSERDAIAKCVIGPRRPVPADSKFSLSELRDVKWEGALPEERADALNAADAILNLRPQPSGETQEAGLDVFGDEVTDVQSRYIIVHQLRASAEIQDEEIKRETGWATTTDRASLMRKAANTIERLALLSARPLALGGQQGVTVDSLTQSVTDETMRALLSCKDVGTGRAHLASIINALSTTPARAEAQDEGAVGEPVAWGFVRQAHEILKSGKPPFSAREVNARGKLRDALNAERARPSPTPAADADRVRADRYYEALVQADLKIRSLPGTDQSDVEFIRAALKSEGSK